MPKTRHIVAALLFTAAASFGQLSSPWNFTQDVARAESQQQPMQWFAAETLELNLWSRRLSAAVDFSDTGLKLLWEVVAQTNVQTTWAATTGTVTTATNGAARYTLNNQQANLPAGSYLGFVRAVWTNGTITSNVVLQYQAITVKASANSGLYPVADPITQAYGITGAHVNAGGSVTQANRTLYFNFTGSYATGGQWNASVAGVSNLALAAYAAASNAAASSTDTTARAWAQAASNLAVLARGSASNAAAAATNAHTLAATASNLAASVFAWGDHATNGYLTAESDPLWSAVSNSIRADLNAKGTGTVGSLSGVTMQGATHTGNLQAASSAGGHLSNMSGSNVLVWGAGGGVSAQFSGALTVNGGSAVATGMPLYVITSNTLSGVDGSGLTNLPGSGSGSYLPLSGGSMTGPITGATYHVTNAGAAALSVSGVKLFIYNTNAPGDILYSDGDTELDMNLGDIDGVNDLQVMTISAVPLSPYVQMNSTLNGEGFAASNFVFYGDGIGITNLWIISPNNQYLNTNAMPREFGWIGGNRNRFNASFFQPGFTNGFGFIGGGGYSNAWLNHTAQGTVLWGGMSNAALSDISGSVLVGGWNNLINNTKCAAILGGRSINLSGEASAALAGQGLTISGTHSQGGGRDNIIAANYGNIAGYQNQIQAGAQASVIGGGSTNIIAGPLYGTIGGGMRNLIGSGGTYGTIPGGASNQVLGVGGFAAGNAAIVSATATGSFFYSAGQLPVTNSTPRSAAFNVPGGFMISGGGSYGADSQQGISVTNLLLRSDGVSVYTQIVVRGIVIQ